MQADHHSQESLEAVAEALWRHAGFGTFKGEENFAERPESIREEYLAEARVALAASRQPVSGGLEGDEAGWELYRCANGHEFAIRAETATGHVVKCAACGTITVTTEGFGAVAALSRVPADSRSGAIAHRDALRAERGYVPADGEQPAETRCWTIYECPTHGLVPRATVDFDSQPPYPAYHKECQEFVERIEVAPADGPVSASRPPEEDFAWKGDDKHPDWQDYVATNLLDTLQRTPDTGDWHGAMRTWCEQHSTGRLKPNPWPDGGLGDRQLTAEERHACKIGAEAIRAMGVGVEDEPVDGDHAELIESLQALGRLASGENPE